LGGSKAGEATWARNVLITFLLSGLWHGASWNYVLWGAYHGVLLVLTRARRILKPAAPLAAGRKPLAAGLLTTAQIVGMFALTMIGWLLFRETELSAVVRDLTLSPFAAPADDRGTGLYLFLLALLYSLPLWVRGSG